jgi:hypothetical protein
MVGAMKIDYRGRIDRRTGREHIGLRLICGPQDGQEVVLRPGVNEVPKEEWEWIKGTAAVAELQAAGFLVVLSGDKGAAFDLSKLPSFEADAMVKRTTDPIALAEWKEQVETSPRLRDVGEGQMWQDVLRRIEKHLDVATTDLEGKPAATRRLRIAGDVEAMY